jgi:tetratricopeptide (TPR) repeat protein
MRSLLLTLTLGLAIQATARAQTPPAAAPAPKQELSFSQFADWNFYNNVGWIALARNELTKAEQMFGRAIEVARIEEASDPRLMARSYGDLAWVLHRQGRDAEAEPLARWALAVREKTLGPESKPLAQTIYTLGAIEVNLNHLDEAEALMTRTLAICERTLGPESLGTADALDDLAAVLVLRRKFDRARPLYERALTIFRGNGPDSAAQHTPLDGLASIDLTEGKLPEAEAHLTKALEMLDRDPLAVPAFHARVLRRKADVLRKLKRPDEAVALEAKAKAVEARPQPYGSVNVRPNDGSRNGRPVTSLGRQGMTSPRLNAPDVRTRP